MSAQMEFRAVLDDCIDSHQTDWHEMNDSLSDLLAFARFRAETPREQLDTVCDSMNTEMAAALADGDAILFDRLFKSNLKHHYSDMQAYLDERIALREIDSTYGYDKVRLRG